MSNKGHFKRQKMLAPWEDASKVPKWAYGVAGFALVVLSSADFVMLGEALGQSFGGWLGYLVVTALLAGFVFVPRLLAHYLHQFAEPGGEGPGAGAFGGKVKAAICCLLLAATLAGYFAVTDFRMSQENANAAMREQASSQASQESRIVVSTSANDTKASAESQTCLLTAILVMTGIYSFALTWARAAAADGRLGAIEQALPEVGARAMLKADEAAAEHEGDLCIRYMAALEAVDSRTVAVEGAKVLLDLVEDPSESAAVSSAIRELVSSAERRAPLPRGCTPRSDGKKMDVWGKGRRAHRFCGFGAAPNA